MTSFPTQARRVRDRALSPQRRLYALRECTLHCAPYGFRATWHHLVVSAGVPCHLDDDPQALIRAVDELALACDVVLPHAQAYAEGRRREKAAGRRVPQTPTPWNSWGFALSPTAPTLSTTPTAPLAAVVRRVLDGHAAGIDADAQCLACGTDRHRRGGPCPVCGVHPQGTTARWRSPSAQERWRQIWRRDLTDHSGAGPAVAPKRP